MWPFNDVYLHSPSGRIRRRMEEADIRILRRRLGPIFNTTRTSWLFNFVTDAPSLPVECFGFNTAYRLLIRVKFNQKKRTRNFEVYVVARS